MFLFMFDDTAGYVVYVFVSDFDGCRLRPWTQVAPTGQASALSIRLVIQTSWHDVPVYMSPSACQTKAHEQQGYQTIS